MNCAIDAGSKKISIKSFKAISNKKLIGVSFTVTNPAAGKNNFRKIYKHFLNFNR